MNQAPHGYGEFRRGWRIVLAAMLGVGLGLSPLPFYTIGVIAPHLKAEFGWGMGQIFFGITVTTFVVLFAGPGAGWLAVRYGVRRVALVSVLLFALAFMSFALTSGSLALYYVTWGLVAAVGAGTLPITWTRGVNAWFEQRKGLALGLTLMGTGVFGIVSKPLTTWLIENWGWRGAYVGLGLLPLLIALPVAWLLFRNTDGEGGTAAAAKADEGLDFAQALRSRRFWLLVAALLPISFALGGPVPNMENILRHNGFAPADVVRLTPFIGLSALVGRLAGGWLIDRWWAPGVAFVMLCLPALSLWLLAGSAQSFGAALLAIVLIGVALGVEYDLMAFLVARYFGMRAYTTIYAWLYVCFAFGAGFGPAVFGWSFDRTGSYTAVLMVSIVVLVAGGASLLLLGRYPVLAKAAAGRPARQPGVNAEPGPIASR